MTEAQVVKHLDSLPKASQEAVMDAVADLCPNAQPHLLTAGPAAPGNVGAFDWAKLLAAIPQLLALFQALFGANAKPPTA